MIVYAGGSASLSWALRENAGRALKATLSPMTRTRMHLLRREASLQSAHSSVPQFMRAARASTPLDHRAGLTKKKWGGSVII